MSSTRIYVACLAAYNNGKLHGAWLDVDGADPETLNEGIQAMLKASPEPGAEEYAVHDHEGFDGFKVGEWPDLAFLCAIADGMREHEDILGAVHSHMGHKDTAEGVEETIHYIEENYQGTFRTLEDWAEEYLSDNGSLSEIPEDLRAYFDFEKWAHDAEIGGDVFTIEGGQGCHVFWNR